MRLRELAFPSNLFCGTALATRDIGDRQRESEVLLPILYFNSSSSRESTLWNRTIFSPDTENAELKAGYRYIYVPPKYKYNRVYNMGPQSIR